MTTKVFVHGNPEVDAIWSLLVAELRARGIDDIVLLSPPGFGAPTPDGWVGDVASYRSWLIGELERIGGSGQVIDLVGHDWGAGHVFGAVADRPELVRSFAADAGGLIHPDYVWHDMAQVWQTPGAGEEMIEAMIGGSLTDRQAIFAGLGAPADIAAAMAEGATPEMGRCILTLYRDAAQPVAKELGQRLLAAATPAGAGDLGERRPVRLSGPRGRDGRGARRRGAAARRVRPLVDVRGAGPSGRRARGLLVESRLRRPSATNGSFGVGAETNRFVRGRGRNEPNCQASAETGVTSTTLRPLRWPNFTVPSTRANSVSSPPMPTFLPGWNLVPRWRTMIVPAVIVGAAEHLHAEALGVGVAAVAGGTATFGLRHALAPQPFVIEVISTTW